MHTAGHANPTPPPADTPAARSADPIRAQVGHSPGPAATTTPTHVQSPAVEKLTDDDLVARLDGFAQRERLTTLEILIHLGEIERRRLWRTLEYRSMFDYCVRRLRYSEGAASRRIRTARLIARYPRVIERIRERRVSLCVASRIARAVLEDGRADLIDQVEGKRLDQVDAMLATHRNPSRPVRESIRLLCVERPIERTAVSDPPRLERGAGLDTAAAPAGGNDTPPSGTTQRANARTGASVESSTGTHHPAAHPGAAPAGQNDGKKITRIERVFRFQFGVNAETMAKFSRVQSLAATRAGRHVDLTDLFAVLCDTYLDRYDPVRRAAQREKTRRKRTSAQAGAEGAGAATTDSEVSGDSRVSADSQVGAESHAGRGSQTEAALWQTRRVPQALRDQVFLRDKGRCTFVSRGGERCTATTNLHVDHIRPFALGGGYQLSNLRLLCSAHNQLMAERTFGRSTVARMSRRE